MNRTHDIQQENERLRLLIRSHIDELNVWMRSRVNAFEVNGYGILTALSNLEAGLRGCADTARSEPTSYDHVCYLLDLYALWGDDNSYVMPDGTAYVRKTKA